MRTLTCLARSCSLHPVCKFKLRRTTVDGGRASLASSGCPWLLLLQALAPALLEGWSWLRFACSAPHSPSLEGGCRRCDCEGRVLLLLPRAHLLQRLRTLSVNFNHSTVPQILRSPEGAEFPIHAEPSNNSKQRSRGQAGVRGKINLADARNRHLLTPSLPESTPGLLDS